MFRRLVSIVVAMVIWTCVSRPQSYPTLQAITARVRVAFDPPSKMYYYSYDVTNGINNIGSMYEFGVDISRDPNSVAYDTIGLRFAGIGFMESDYRNDYPVLGARVLPVGFLSLPPGWISFWGNMPEASVMKDRAFIAPGQSVNGVILMSKALPGIRNCVARPDFEADRYFPDMDSPAADSLTADQMDSIMDACNYYGPTVAPWAPASVFRPLPFLDTLSSFVNQSRSFGWIATQLTADKYTGFYNTARSQLQAPNIIGAISTLLSVLTSANSDSTSLITPEAYALIYYNTQYLIGQLQLSLQVKGGIFNSQATATLSVRAKPNSNVTSSDTLIALTATVRWQSRYTLTLGTVSSPTYGFSKYGTVNTVGTYSYQQFRTSAHVPLNWSAGSEYEIFTVPVIGSAGVDDFSLTNALSGGQWFVDIDYLDKTDSVFYQPVATCTGITSLNKADNSGPTAYNGARHLAKTTSKLHEVYSSGGQIVYRRKDLSGNWEVTKRLSDDSDSLQNDPSVMVAHDGSIHVVWQKRANSTQCKVWYARSTDGGTSWSVPFALAANVTIDPNQWNAYPVIGEYGTTQIVVVWCSVVNTTTGLQYTISNNLGLTWSTIASLTSAGRYVWYPSIAAASNYLMLTYDGRSNDLYSRIYNGTWQAEVNVSSGDGMNNNMYSSVAVDPQNRPMAAWSANSYSHNEYTIVYRSGNTDGSWGSGFVQFAVDAPSVHDFYPSVTYVNRSGLAGVDIVYASTANAIKVNEFVMNWIPPVVLSTNGQWPNTSIANQTTSPGYPVRFWTDQTGSPYQVVLQSDGNYSFQKVAPPSSPTSDLHRRIVVEGQRSGSTIWFDLAPIKVVTRSNDTIMVPFKTLDLTKPFVATITNAWDYLGTDQITLPSNARSLILETDIISYAKGDSLSSSNVNSFTFSSFKVDGIKASQTLPFVSSQASISGKRIIDVSSEAGQSITLRMIGAIPAASTEPVTIGVGDVFIARKP